MNITKKSDRLVELYQNKIWRPRLLALFSRVLSSVKISEEQIIELLEHHIELAKGNSDKKIILGLKKLVKKPHHPYNQKANISRAFRKWKLIKPQLRTRITGVLDFGGNVGDAAYVFGRMIAKVAKEQTFVVDIDEWSGEKWEPRKDITFVHFDNMSQLIKQRKKVDLITISHVLHHINPDHYPDIMDLFNSMLTSKGAIMLYEHNCSENNWATLIDLEHYLYDIVVSQQTTFDKTVKTFYAQYLSIQNWKKIFSKYFEPYNIQELNNPDNSFYMFLRKRKS